MLTIRRFHLICVLVLGTALLIGMVPVRLSAQGAGGQILGTVTDSSGASVPDAKVQATNTGTRAVQTTASDAQGRYRLQALPVGEYEVQAENSGFQTSVRRGITLDAGANVVVDFALTVGQVTQTVVVEAEVSQVETTSSALGTLVEPTQMRELPLNGRNFEELVLLAPGVVNNRAANINGLSSIGTFTGNSNWWSVSGSRSNGQGVLMDGTNIQNYQDRGSGSGILGTSLGVDSIAQFQVLTNTYGAQYGGNGSVVNSVTRSGTNVFHGSLYEFFRNSALDAKNFTDTVRQPYKRNQFGGTLGGPIKQDKMFFFANYEGIRQHLGQSRIDTVPDSYTLQGLLPTTVVGGAPAACANVGTINPAYPTISYVNCGAGSANAATFAKMQPYLNLYNRIVAGFPMTEVTNSNGTPTGTALISDTAKQLGTENYVLGRYDWTISNTDSLFARYLIDDGYVNEPFATTPGWPQLDWTRNQFLTVGDKHIFSNDVVNALNFGLTRTYLDLHSVGKPTDLLAWNGELYSDIYGSEGPTEGGLNPGGGVVTLGPGQVAPIWYVQNKFGIADDVFWTKGAHSLRVGGSAYRVQTDGLHAFPGVGTWTFANLPSFFTNVPRQFSGPCNFSHSQPGCVSSAGTPYPLPSSRHNMRETQFSLYVQDDWKVTPTLTLNLGLRYSPTSNPWDDLNQIYILLPVPFGPNGDLPSSTANGSPVPSTFTPAKNFMLKNPSWHSLDPRIGLAWDPFKDHKTSVRAGYGIFHTVLQARDYSYGAFYAFPWLTQTQQSGLVFPTPAQNPVSSSTNITYGTNPFLTTPYLQQWNLSIQREVMRNTVLTVSYVGSHGVHLFAQADSNPPVRTGGLAAAGSGAFCGLAAGAACGGISLTSGQILWPSYPGQLQSLVFKSGGGTFNPNGTITCTAPIVLPAPGVSQCTLATASGQPILNPATGLPAGTQAIQTGTSFRVVSNNRVNPYFSFLNSGATNTDSHYNGLQAGLVRRMSNNFSMQISYSYSECVDISSGSWGGEGGTNASIAYDLRADRGPCNFQVRHNLTTNGLLQIPFKGNQLIEGWQLGGIFYYSTGAPFTVTSFGDSAFDLGGGAARANYSAGNPGCNSQPIDFRVTTNGTFYVNPACFTSPSLGEPGNMGRNVLFTPSFATFNANLQKNTRVSERINIQFRMEAFNLFNRKNFTFTGQGAVGLTQQGTGSAAALATGITSSTFGKFVTVTGYPLNGSARQIQAGLKIIF